MRHLFVDCRFDLFDRDAGRRAYEAGHIPGAVFLDLDQDLSAPPTATSGRHPLPSAEQFAAVASRAGIDADTYVIAYDDVDDRGAARLWWLLRHFGHEQVAVLHGGTTAWLGELEAGPGPEAGAPATFIPRERDDDTIDADELHARLGEDGLLLLDARPPERFRGEVLGPDAVGGHIPGARSMPYADPVVPDAALTAAEVVVSCGSGVTACVDLLALHRAGRTDAKLYPGSWSQWTALGLPVETGPERTS